MADPARRIIWREAVVLTAFVVASLWGWARLAEEAGWFDPLPPGAWREAAGASDVLDVPGHDIAYWGRPDARYGVAASRRSRKPRAIVVHYTFPKPLLSLVRYGHRPDPRRGNAAYGYHFYIARDGRIVQGAPLSRRTNHIKSTRHVARTGVARHLWSANTIGVSLVGGCDPWQSPLLTDWGKCGRETVTAAQIESGLAVITALQARYDIPCREVYGHGDLQTDRQSIEGRTLSRRARGRCDVASG